MPDKKILSMMIVALVAAGSPVLAQAGSYADDLSRVYEAPQFIRAIKEAVTSTMPPAER